MGKVRVFDNPRTGTISIIVPNYDIKLPQEPESDFEDAVFTKTMQAVGMQSARYIDVESSQIPSDRTFRKAWERGTGSIQVNMTKARKIHMGRIRGVVNAEMEKKDKLHLDALMSGDKATGTRIASEKRALKRILTSTDLSSATTPAALKAVWPSNLPTFNRKIHKPDEE